MSGLRWQGAAGVAGVGVLVATGLVLASVYVVPAPPEGMALPSAGELMSLEGYLDPAQMELPTGGGVPDRVVIETDPFSVWDYPELPDGDGRARVGGEGPGERSSGASEGNDPAWTLSAILIAGERRIAIVNDRMVRSGDRLEEGVRVETIESDHVVIMLPDGERVRLELER